MSGPKLADSLSGVPRQPPEPCALDWPWLWGAGALLIAASFTTAWLVVPFHGQSLLMLAGAVLIRRGEGWGHRETPRAK